MLMYKNCRAAADIRKLWRKMMEKMEVCDWQR